MVCDAEDSALRAYGSATDCDIRIALGNIEIHLTAAKLAARIDEIMREIGAHA